MLVLSTTGGFLEGSVSEDAEVGFLIIQHSSDCLLLRWRHPVFETTWTTTPAIASVENYHSTRRRERSTAEDSSRRLFASKSRFLTRKRPASVP